MSEKSRIEALEVQGGTEATKVSDFLEKAKAEVASSQTISEKEKLELFRNLVDEFESLYSSLQDEGKKQKLGDIFFDETTKEYQSIKDIFGVIEATPPLRESEARGEIKILPGRKGKNGYVVLDKHYPYDNQPVEYSIVGENAAYYIEVDRGVDMKWILGSLKEIYRIYKNLLEESLEEGNSGEKVLQLEKQIELIEDGVKKLTGDDGMAALIF